MITDYDGGIAMRDWDRNGKIDARDRYIFHEIILKEDHDNNTCTYSGNSRWNRTANIKSKEHKEPMSGYEIFFWGVLGILALIGLFVS